MRDLRRNRPILIRPAFTRRPVHDAVRSPPVLTRRSPRLERSAFAIARPTAPRAEPARLPSFPPPAAGPDDFPEDAYLDYRRSLTAEGGVLIVYKDLDLRWRHTLWRLFAAATAMALAGVVILTRSPVGSPFINSAALLLMAVVNWLIVRKPVELHRSVEIRPDGMILDGTDIFWLGMMEEGWPVFFEDENGNQILCGTYGTRFIEYLTVRSFEDEDRAPEVFATHLQEAMKQLWGAALTHGTVDIGSRGQA
jgi:hypothetical protein